MENRRIIGNFLEQANQFFPGDAETLSYLQDSISLIQTMGNLFGDKVILTGCNIRRLSVRPGIDDERNPKSLKIKLTRNPGYVFVRTGAYPQGEILYFEGGAYTKMYISEEHIAVNEQGYEFPRAYTMRSLVSAGVIPDGAEGYEWSDFTSVKTLVQLQERCNEIESRIGSAETEPVGVVKMFAGATLPAGYLYCDGQDYLISDYPELSKALNGSYDQAYKWNSAVTLYPTYVTGKERFRVPDLRGRFIVGINSEEPGDYGYLSKAGGFKDVTLTARQSGLPSHVHSYRWNSFGGSGGDRNPLRFRRGAGEQEFGFGFTDDSVPRNAMEAHENRPPYYTLAYIIKCK